MNDVLSKNAFPFQSSGKEVNDLLPPCSTESGRMPALPDGGQPGQKSRNTDRISALAALAFPIHRTIVT